MGELESVMTWLKASGAVPSQANVKLALRLQLEELCETAMALGADQASFFKEELARAYNSFNLSKAPKEIDEEEVLDGLADQLVVMMNLVYYLNIHPKRLMDKFISVMDSNWSKYCLTEEEAKATVKAYVEGTHPDKPGEKIVAYYVESDPDFNGSFYIVRRCIDNKILKSINYQPPKSFNNG